MVPKPLPRTEASRGHVLTNLVVEPLCCLFEGCSSLLLGELTAVYVRNRVPLVSIHGRQLGADGDGLCEPTL